MAYVVFLKCGEKDKYGQNALNDNANLAWS